MISDFSNWYGNDYVINAKAEIPAALLMNGFIWLDILLHIYACWYTEDSETHKTVVCGCCYSVATRGMPRLQHLMWQNLTYEHEWSRLQQIMVRKTL